ncbi:MAG TPA: beta-propeller fold lactonase family protein [Terriglobales bacterium]|jgi:6-phosphogluconolactonase (cycloisomerase 2 family)
MKTIRITLWLFLAVQLAFEVLPWRVAASAQDVVVRNNPGSYLTLSPSNVNFGNQIVGGSVVQTITITNLDTVGVDITSISTAAPFNQANNCPRLLRVRASCTATVTFTPTSGGVASGALTVTPLLRKPVSAILSGNGEVLTSIQITPSQAAIKYGQSLQMKAIAVFQDGSTQDFTKLVAWTSSDPSIIVVSNDPASPGVLNTESYGVVTVNGSYGANGVGGSAVIASQPVVSRFAYVANVGDGTISAYTIDNNNGGRWRDNAYYPTPGINSMVVDPFERFLYYVSPTQSGIYRYSINGTTGALTPLPATSFSSSGQTYTVMDPFLGKFLYIVAGSQIYSFTVDPNSGALTTAGIPLPLGSVPSGVAIDNSGNFLYVSGAGGNSVTSFQIDRTYGFLTFTGTVPTGGTPESPAVDATGCVYVPSSADGTVSAYTPANNGALTPVSGSPFTAGGNPSSVLPVGGLLVTVNLQQSQLVVFQTGTGCTLSGFPFLPLAFSAQGSSPNLAVTDGNYLYVENSGSNEIATFGIDFTGGNLNYAFSTRTRSLPAQAGLGYGIKPVSYLPKFALVHEGTEIETFYIDPKSGALTSIAQVASVNGSAVATDPTGNYAYDIDGSRTVSYRIDQNSGILTFLSFGTGHGEGIAVEPSGRFLYEPTGSSVLQFLTANGTLFGPSACVACSGDEPALVDPTGRFYSDISANGFGRLLVVSVIDPTFGSVSTPNAISLGAGCTPACTSAMDPRGRYLYLGVNMVDINLIKQYSVNASTGMPAEIGAITTQYGYPAGLAIDPSGRFLFVSDEDFVNGVIEIVPFAIDQVSGALSPISSGIPIPGSPGSFLVTGMAVDSSGSFLYVQPYTDGSVVSSTIYGFSIDQTSGALSPVPGSPFPLHVETPNSLALTGFIQ